MKITVIGHYSRDLFHRVEGPPVEREGGLYRAVAHLASLAGKQDRVVPVFGVDAADREEVQARFEALPGVETSGIFSFRGPIHEIHYFPSGDGRRVACVKEFASPIPFEKVKKYLDADGVLLNMISGLDITLETLDEIRMAVRGEGTRIHFDFHNLTQGVSPDGGRVRRPVVAWRRWAFMLDTVQMNAEEIAGLTGESLTEQQTAGHILTLGVKGVVVTRGVEGATLYWNEHKKVIRKDFGTPPGNAPSEVVGAGDLFGAAFCAGFVRSGDLQASTESAVLAAFREAATAPDQS